MGHSCFGVFLLDSVVFSEPPSQSWVVFAYVVAKYVPRDFIGSLVQEKFKIFALLLLDAPIHITLVFFISFETRDIAKNFNHYKETSQRSCITSDESYIIRKLREFNFLSIWKNNTLTA